MPSVHHPPEQRGSDGHQRLPMGASLASTSTAVAASLAKPCLHWREMLQHVASQADSLDVADDHAEVAARVALQPAGVLVVCAAPCCLPKHPLLLLLNWWLRCAGQARYEELVAEAQRASLHALQAQEQELHFARQAHTVLDSAQPQRAQAAEAEARKATTQCSALLAYTIL